MVQEGTFFKEGCACNLRRQGWPKKWDEPNRRRGEVASSKRKRRSGKDGQRGVRERLTNKQSLRGQNHQKAKKETATGREVRYGNRLEGLDEWKRAPLTVNAI
jgi:hypothetical protein